MSWAQYIKSMKDRAPNDMSWGAIIGKDDGAIWSAGPEKNFTPNEAQRIARCFKKRDFSSMQQHGFDIGGQHYTFLRHDKDQKYVIGKARGSGGMHLQETKRAILIAFCKEGKQMGNVNKAVGEIGSYLSGSGH